jgi:hypothetical protein
VENGYDFDDGEIRGEESKLHAVRLCFAELLEGRRRDKRPESTLFRELYQVELETAETECFGACAQLVD